MGFFSKQFIDVIEWTESGDDILAFKYRMEDNEIQTGGRLVVRETQAALFVNEGQIADQFMAGTHKLTTQNLPLLTNLKHWDKLFNSPFKSDVYFFSLREKTDQKWGSQQPITIRDKELGPIRLRAFGNYSYKINDPKTFYKRLSGTKEVYSVGDLEGQLRALVVTSIASSLGASDISFWDMAANQTRFSETLKSGLAAPFNDYGLKLTNFFVESLTLPDEVQAHVDKLSAQRMTGDLNQYAQFQAADSIKTAAANPGGLAGAGVGIAAGMQMGQAIMGSMGAGGGKVSSEDAIGKINQLHELMKSGALSQAEFDAKKAELLKKIT